MDIHVLLDQCRYTLIQFGNVCVVNLLWKYMCVVNSVWKCIGVVNLYVYVSLIQSGNICYQFSLDICVVNTAWKYMCC